MSGAPVARRVDPAREPATLAAMESVMRQAFGSGSYATSIDRICAAQPDGLAVVEVDGEVVGTGCGIAYPDAGFGWIGLIATRPDHERRGIGTLATAQVIAALANHHCAPVLDASDEGAPVYTRMGFTDHGPTRVIYAGRPVVPARASARDDSGIPVDPVARVFREDDLPGIVALDAACFGAERERLIAPLVRRHAERTQVATTSDGTIVGYSVAQPRSLAPLIADGEAALYALLAGAAQLTWSEGVRIDVPFESAHLRALGRHGFQIARELRHMRRDIDALPGRRHCIAGQVSLGEG